MRMPPTHHVPHPACGLVLLSSSLKLSVRTGGPANGAAAGADAPSSSDDNSSVEQAGGDARAAGPLCGAGPGKGPATDRSALGDGGGRRKRARVGSVGSVSSQRLRSGMAANTGAGAAAAESASQPGAHIHICSCHCIQECNTPGCSASSDRVLGLWGWLRLQHGSAGYSVRKFLPNAMWA